MKTPQKDTIVYSRHGSRAKFVAEVDGKYFVTPEIEYQKYDGDVEYDWGDTTAWNEIFAKPPTEVLHEEVVRLEGEVNHKLEELNELREKIRETEKAIAAQKQKFTKYEQLKHLELFIEGKIAYYVFSAYNGIEIIEFKEAMKSSDEGIDKFPRLLSLFGKTNGNLEWAINRWSDGSGTNQFCVPCVSYEHALEEAQKIVNDIISGSRKDSWGQPITLKYKESIVDAAEKFGIKIPDEIKREVRDAREAARLSKIESVRKELEETKKRLENLENGGEDTKLYSPFKKK